MDPVRFISNNSTGTMGRCLVRAARQRGHHVTWVECPVKVKTAIELQKKLSELLPKNDVLIMAAAVCDVRPAMFSKHKIKKEKLSAIPVLKNPDILAGLAKKKKSKQIFIGFGIESENILENGYKKLKSKGLELIVLQRVTKDKTPFGEKPVDVFILDKKKNTRRFRSISKKKLARHLIQEAESLSRVKI